MCWCALVRRMQQTSPFQGSANATLQKQFFSSSVSPKIVYSKVPKGVDLDYFSCSPVCCVSVVLWLRISPADKSYGVLYLQMRSNIRVEPWRRCG